MAMINIPDYLSEIKMIAHRPVGNSDGCGFIITLISREFAGMPNSFFLGVGKLSMLIGNGGACAFWSKDVFNEVVKLLSAEIDAYSIGETLNEKALRPVISEIIERNKETGEFMYEEYMDHLRDIMSEMSSKSEF